MTQQRKSTRPNRPLKPAMPLARAAAAAGGAPAADDALPTMVWVALAALAVFVQVIVLAFTPYTYLLDEIKVTLFFIMGPILLLIAGAAILMRQAPLPSRSIGLGLGAYFLIVVLSTMVSAYPWIGKFYIVFTWASAGFFMTAFAITAWRRGAYHMIRFLVLLLLIEVGIGFFLYDVTQQQHISGIALLRSLLYGPGTPANPSPVFFLIDTLTRADDTLQSTILNRDFFAGFCCMLVPFAYLLSFHPGPTRHPLAWRVVGIVTAVLGSLTIFLCQSKGEWFVWVFAVAFFIAMFFRIGFFHLSDLKRGHMLGWLIGVTLLLGAVGWMKSPTLLFQLKSTGASLESREIIWSGAWTIFTDNFHNQVIGAGPGTFRIYFSGVRRPDYYLHGINNVTTLSHNYFLDVLSETGVLGMAAFGLLLAGLFGLGLRHALKKENDLFLRLALTAAITGLMSIFGSNMTSPSARWVIVATPMWTVMGVLAGLIYQAQRGPYDSERGRQEEAGSAGAPARLAPAVAIGLLVLGAPMLWWGTSSGTRYFDSLKKYATGLSYLETAANMMKGDVNPETLITYFNESAKHFESALKVDPTNTSAYYKVGSSYTSLSQIWAQLAANLAAKGQVNEARDYLARGDQNLAQAKRAYETLMAYDKDYAEIHYNMGIIYQLYAEMLQRGIQNGLRGEEFTAAKVKEYENKALLHLEMMEKTSIKPEVAMMLGGQYTAMQRFDKARDVYKAASHRSSADEVIISNYFEAAVKAKDPAGACDALELLWLRRPARNDYLEQLVSLAHQNKFSSVLERVIARLEHINPVHPRLFEARTYLKQAQGKTADAEHAGGTGVNAGASSTTGTAVKAEAASTTGTAVKAEAAQTTGTL